MVRLADANYAMENGLFHDVKVGLGCAQTVCQPMLGFPFLHCTHCISHAMPDSSNRGGSGGGWSRIKVRRQGRGGRGLLFQLHYSVLIVLC